MAHSLLINNLLAPARHPADLQSAVKNVLTYLGSVDLKSAAKEYGF